MTYGSTWDALAPMIQGASQSDDIKRMLASVLRKRSANRFQAPQVQEEYDASSIALAPKLGDMIQFDRGGVPVPRGAGQAGFQQYNSGGSGARSSNNELARMLSRRANRNAGTPSRSIGGRAPGFGSGNSADALEQRRAMAELDLLEKQSSNYESDRQREMLLRILGALG